MWYMDLFIFKRDRLRLFFFLRIDWGCFFWEESVEGFGVYGVLWLVFGGDFSLGVFWMFMVISYFFSVEE